MNTERSTSTCSPSPTPLNNITPLPDDLSVCHAMIRELIDSLRHSQRECEGVQQRLDLLLRKLYGPKAERFDPQQSWLLPEMAPTNATTETAASPSAESPLSDDAARGNGKHGKRKSGR
jgi:hypothetical protein